ncbi:pyocin knob domain-containing protein [Serratia marcescens]|uniref:pyocin knob domain-containing protein n=1 Tax=Serratia marcescens TaxID=615 RepID=UPI001D1417E2
MIIGFGNNVVSSLAADITATQTTIQVMPGAGALFAGLLTYDYANDSNPLKVYAKITLTDAKETVFEVCHLTAVNNDMLTVVRGQEGTAAKGWSLNDVIANFATRGSENQFVQIEQLQSGHYTSAVAGGTANGLTLALPATFFLNGSTEWALKTPILIYPTLNNTGASTLQLTMGGRVMGTYPLVKGSNTPLRAGDIVAKNPFLAVFNADQGRFIVLNPTTDVGSVRSVNAIGPDVGGNVTLKALDVGALPVYPNALTVDLNILGATGQEGVYCQTQNAGATTDKHYPANLAGTLLVTPSAYGCQQEYTTYSTRQKFVRGLTGPWNGKDGPWSDWASPPAYGWGMGPQHRDNAYNNVAMVYRINGASANAPGPNVYGVISLPCDGGPSTSYLAVQNSGRAFFGYSNLPANGVIWTEAYTVKNPPTADVIGAVKKSGDRMSGALGSTYTDTYRIVAGQYGTFWRNDGNALYLMLTNAGDQWGTFNNLRPFAVSTSDGSINVGTSFSVNYTGYINKLGVNPYTSNGQSFNQTNGLHIQGAGDQYGDIYYLETVGKYGSLSFHIHGGGLDAYPAFNNNGSLSLNGSWPAISNSSGTTWHPDGNVEGPQWGGYLSNWLNQNISNAQNNAQNWAYQNLVQNVRLTGRINRPDTGGQVRVPDGCVFTGMSGANYDPSIWASYSYVQVLINGSWRNIGTS